MSLHDLIQLSRKCEELEKKLVEAVEVIRYCANEEAYFNALDGGPHSVSDIFRRAKQFLAKMKPRDTEQK